jgi:hypothetical protein
MVTVGDARAAATGRVIPFSFGAASPDQGKDLELG